MLRSAVLLLAACAASAVLAAPSGLLSKRTSPNEPPPVIDLGYARVQGYLNSTDSQYWWKGIRYASADRFQAPRTPATHTAAVYNASAYGPICFQASEGAVTLQGKPPVANFTIANQSEDCLYLNINAPAGACEGSNLPVLVWIHGGGECLACHSLPLSLPSRSLTRASSHLSPGYAAGSAAQGSDFAEFITNAGGDIVVVTIQYRLGPFGFLAGQETADFGALNAGLLDQVRRRIRGCSQNPTVLFADHLPTRAQQFALQWVQQHVSKFGGNPSHVTIWGESAGAGSVLNQVLANGGNTPKALGLKQPLFQAAIGSSVFLPTQVAYDAPIAEEIYHGLADFVGCGNSSQGSFACLQAKDAGTVAAAALNLSKAAPIGYWTYVPVLEGQGGFLQERASLLLAKGSKNLNGVSFLSSCLARNVMRFETDSPLPHSRRSSSSSASTTRTRVTSSPTRPSSTTRPPIPLSSATSSTSCSPACSLSSPPRRSRASLLSTRSRTLRQPATPSTGSRTSSPTRLSSAP